MKIVAENGTMWLPLASLAGKFGTCTDWRWKEHQQEGLKYTEYLPTRVRYSQTNTSDTNLWASGKVRNCDFEWLQDRHNSGSCFIQKVPHTRLQKMWLRRRLGNCYSNLPKMSCFTTQQHCMSKWNYRVLQKHSMYPCAEVVDSLWREASSPQCSQSEESGIIPVSANRSQKKKKRLISNEFHNTWLFMFINRLWVLCQAKKWKLTTN